MANRQPCTPAVISPEGRTRGGRVRYAHLTYRQLERESEAIAAGLRLQGVLPGSRAAVMVRPGLDLFALTFALFRAGIAPVLIDPGIGVKQLGRCLGEAEPDVFLGVPEAVILRGLLGWGRRTIRRVIWVDGERSRWPYSLHLHTTLDAVRRQGRAALEREPALVPSLHACGRSETAAILFTSGSTGPPKGAIYTHSMLEAQVDRLRTLYAIEPGEIDLCTFPLFALFAPALGMTSIIPDMDPTRPARVTPSNIFDVFQDFGVTNLFGSPALLRRLAPAGVARGLTFPTLKRVVSAGAPAASRTLEQFTKMLVPPAQIFTPYGATEALPVASIGSDEMLGETRRATDRGAGVCVGMPVPGITVRIIRVSDGPIPTWSDDLEVPDGEIGEIAVSGPVVSRKYFNRPEATALAKIADPDNGTFFHRMGDVGYLDDSGRIWFCGRKAHRVVVDDETLYTIPCEAVFNTHPRVARTALVGVSRDGRMTPVLCVEPVARLAGPEQERIVNDLRTIAERFPHTRRIGNFLFHDSFPVDIRHNAKIFREKLAVWAAGRLR
jgi:acyl-CoA synthetase (AMP-forming)/AMP-acid ligase II